MKRCKQPSAAGRAKRAIAVLVGVALAWGFAPPPAPAVQPAGDGVTTAYHAARIYTGAAPALRENAYLLVRAGKVVGIAAAAPAGADVVELGSAVIIPGLVAADSTISDGVGRVPNAAGGLRSTATNLRAIDGFDRYADRSRYLRAGITTAYIAPGRKRLIGGRGAIVKLAGGAPGERVLVPAADLFVNVSAAALKPPAIFDPPLLPSAEDPLLPEQRQHPLSRAGMALALRDLFARAGEYQRRWALPAAERAPFDAILASCADLGSVDVRMLCQRADEIEHALALQRELFPVAGSRRVVLCGGAEAWRLADEIAAAKLPLILEVQSWLGRIAPNQGAKIPALRDEPECAARLAAAGVRFAIAVREGGPIEQLLPLAGQSIRAGLSADRALRCVTSEAASILGVGDRVGALEPGRDADFAVLDGEPFALATHVRATYIDGLRVYRCGAAGGEDAAAAAARILRADRILSGRGEEIEDGEVLVIDGRIAEVGRRVGRPEGVEIIDYGQGSVITPGFIDARSTLGLEGITSSFAMGTDLAAARHRRIPGGRSLALAGVTSAAVCSARLSSRGSPVGVFKTFRPAGAPWREAVLEPLAGIRFSVAGSGRAQAIDGLRSALKRGKEYHEKWLAYEAALAKWRQEKPSAAAPAAAKAAAEQKGAAKTTGEKKPKGDKSAKKTPAPPDPDNLAGTWEGVVADLPGVGRVPFTAKLNLVEGVVSGSIASPKLSGPDLVIERGTFEKGELKATFALPQMGPASLQAKVAGEKMSGEVVIGEVKAAFEARRTALAPARIQRVYKPAKAPAKTSKSKSSDGRPKMPRKDKALEPYRRVFRGELTILVDCARRDEIEAAVKILAQEFKVPAVLVGATEYRHVADLLAEARPGVLLGAPAMVREKNVPRVPVVDLSRLGLRVAFQSGGASDGARTLPLLAAWAVHYGLSPREALRALTWNTAKLFHVEDRIGCVAAGRDADLVVFSGDPFDLSSEIREVWVRGRRVAHREPAWR